MANAPWKTYGGIHKASYLNNLSVYSFTADVFTLRQSVYGMFDICGELHVSGNANIDSNIIGNNLTIHNDISTNRLFVNEKTIHYDDTDISGGNLLVQNGNVTVRDGSVYLLENMDVSGHIYLKNELYLGNSFKAFLYGTDTSGNIGINTRSPIATLDISSQYPLAFNVGSNVNSQMYSIPLQNNRKRGVLFSANDAVSKIGFYNDSSLSTVTSVPDAYIQYNSGGTLTLDASQNISLASNVSITNRPANTDARVMGETLVVYDTSSGPYLYPVYENPASATGTAISLISNDLSSNTFMNIIAPNKQGISVGGGAYPNDSKRSMGLIGWRDVSANYTPSINIVSGTSHLRQKSTIGINTHAPETETYAFDVNGPTHIKNGELTISNQTDFEILVLTTGRSAPNNGIAIGTPYKYDASNVELFKYKHKILYTVDGGENWYSSLDTSGDEFEKFDASYRSAYVYDSSLSIIACDRGVAYYTGTGYLPIENREVWQSIRTPASLLTKSIRAVYIGTFGSVKRTFFGLSPTSEIYWFNLPSDIYTDVNGFASDASSNQYGTITLTAGNAGVQAIDGCGNSIWISCGASIFKGVINVTPPTTTLSYTNTQNSENYTTLSVYDTNNIIAAGKNIITYTKNGGTSWTDVILNGITVNKVIACDASNAIAVCNAGIILTSTDGYATWMRVSSNALNTSGNANRITDPSYNLTGVAMVNTNNFFISKVIKAYQTGAPPTLGNTSLFHAHIPNVFNNTTNYVFDVSGSIRLSGDMNVNDGGKIASNNSTFRLLDNGVNRINIGGEAASVYIGNTNSSKVVMNYDLNVLHDASINRNLEVNGVVQSIYYEGLNNSSNINIGGVYDGSGRIINIGHFDNDAGRNYIYLSGPKDLLKIDGSASFVKDISTGKRIIMNAVDSSDNQISSTAAGSGLWFADIGKENRGYFVVSKDLGGYVIKSVGRTNANTIQIDVSNLIVPPTQNTALPFLYTTPAAIGKDSDYTMGICPIDPSNIMIINKYKSNLPSQQTVDTSFSVIGPMSVGMSTANPQYVIEISGNSHIMGDNITFDTSYTVVNNAMSVGKRGNASAGYCLDVSGNAYFSGGNLIIYDKIGIGKTIAAGTDAILDIKGIVRIDGDYNKVSSTNTIFDNFVSIGKALTVDVGYVLDVSGGVKIDGSNVTIKSNSTILNKNVSIGTAATATAGLILDVSGNVKMSGVNVTIASDSTIVNKTMSIGKTSAATSEYNLDVCGNVQIDGSKVIVYNNMSVGTKAQAVTGYILDVFGNVQIAEGNVIIKKSTHGNIFIAASTGIMLDVSGGIRFDGSGFTVNSSNTIVKNNMSIGKTSAAGSGLTLDVNGNTAISTNLTVSGNTKINNILDVSGIAISSNGLSVSGIIPATTNALKVNGNAEITSNLKANGITISSNGLSVSGNTIGTTTLKVDGNTEITTNLTVTGNTKLNKILDVSGITISSNGLSVSGVIPTTTNTLKVDGNTEITTNLTVTGNTKLNKILDVSGIAISSNGLSVSGNVTGTTNCLIVNGNIRYGNVIVQKNATITSTTPLSYPLSQSYDIQSSSNTTITLPAIDATIIGSTINFYKSASATIVVTIDSSGAVNRFVKNGSTDKTPTSFVLESSKTSTTLLACLGSPNYWVEIGSGVGKDLTLNGNLTVSGTASVTSNLTANGITISSNGLSVSGNTTGTISLKVYGNADISNNLTANGITISSNGLSVSGIIPTTENVLKVNGNTEITGTIRYRNLLVQSYGNITATSGSLGYPLRQTYDIQTTAPTSITLPAIDASILGSTINFYKSANKTIVVTINSASSTDKFIKNGSIDKTASFSIIDGTTSTTLLASGTTSSAYYWVEIGAGGGGGNTFTTGLNVSGVSNQAGYTANIAGNVIATSYNATSDRRLKNNITPLYSQWNAILHITPVSFDWIQDGRPDIGFIAQEIHSAYPTLRPNHKNIDLSKSTIEEPVDLSGNPIYYTIDYGRMTPFLWQGMREIMQRVEQLENENKEFKERIRILEDRA